MSSVVISGDTSGTVTVAAPAVAGSNTLTLQAATATNAVNTLGTAVASTSGTSIDFTGLPSWIKRITVMFNGVSTNGTSPVQIQIGSGSVTTSGYSSVFYVSTATSVVTSGFSIAAYTGASDARTGAIYIYLLSSNTYIAGGQITQGTLVGGLSGNVTLSGALDRVRITTVNGTDTFDAGTINILYEG